MLNPLDTAKKCVKNTTPTTIIIFEIIDNDLTLYLSATNFTITASITIGTGTK